MKDQAPGTAGTNPSTGADIAELDPDTRDLVERFSRALAFKLLKSQRKRGLTNQWARGDWLDEARRQLRSHVDKGDPLDVGAYAAFLWHHGASTAIEPDNSPGELLAP